MKNQHGSFSQQFVRDLRRVRLGVALLRRRNAPTADINRYRVYALTKALATYVMRRTLVIA